MVSVKDKLYLTPVQKSTLLKQRTTQEVKRLAKKRNIWSINIEHGLNSIIRGNRAHVEQFVSTFETLELKSKSPIKIFGIPYFLPF